MVERGMFAGSSSVIPPGKVMFGELSALTGIPRTTLTTWRARGLCRGDLSGKPRFFLRAAEFSTANGSAVFYAGLDDVEEFLEHFPDDAVNRAKLARALGRARPAETSDVSAAAPAPPRSAPPAEADREDTGLLLELALERSKIAALTADLRVAQVRIENLEAEVRRYRSKYRSMLQAELEADAESAGSVNQMR